MSRFTKSSTNFGLSYARSVTHFSSGRLSKPHNSLEAWLSAAKDEKWVTERAYDNPKFVEDLVRDVAGQLKGDDRILSLVVEAENFESIHNHSAYAKISLTK